jgi:hypothetical protein
VDRAVPHWQAVCRRVGSPWYTLESLIHQRLQATSGTQNFIPLPASPSESNCPGRHADIISLWRCYMACEPMASLCGIRTLKLISKTIKWRRARFATIRHQNLDEMEPGARSRPGPDCGSVGRDENWSIISVAPG